MNSQLLHANRRLGVPLPRREGRTGTATFQARLYNKHPGLGHKQVDRTGNRPEKECLTLC